MILRERGSGQRARERYDTTFSSLLVIVAWRTEMELSHAEEDETCSAAERRARCERASGLHA